MMNLQDNQAWHRFLNGAAYCKTQADYEKRLRPYRVKRFLLLPNNKKVEIEMVKCNVGKGNKATSFYRLKI